MAKAANTPPKRSRSNYLKQEPEIARSLMARAAYLYYREGRPQREIATVLTKELQEHHHRDTGGLKSGRKPRVSQTQVSRLLVRAHNEDIVKIEINAFYREDLQKQLLPLLEPYCIKKVRVVGRGDGKNIHQLGLAGAEVALECIQAVEREYVRLTLSCGETLQEVTGRLVESIRRLDVRTEHLHQSTRKLICFPHTLNADYLVKPIYPTTLVTGLATITGLRSYQIEAYAASLPQGFYEWRKDNRKRADAYLRDGKIQDIVVNQAAQADVFLLGIGTSPTYHEFLKSFPVEDKSRDAYVAEIGFTGIAKDGSWDKEVADLIIGVSSEALSAACTSPKRYSIAVAGGDGKKEAVAAALKTKCFNVLVTDENIAYSLLGPTPPTLVGAPPSAARDTA